MERQDRRKICRYYARGKCVKEDCPFVHQQQTKKPCKFWVQTGFCRKGKNCQFFHATKQEEKKDKKFTEKHKGDFEPKFERNFIDKKEQSKKRIPEQKPFRQEQQTKVQAKIQTKREEQQVDPETSIKMKEELLKELEETGTDKLQFFKQYPKSFPDHSKTPEVKEQIKKVQERYFKEKPFLQLLKQLPSKEEQEYYQIIRRYQDSFKLESQDQPKVYFINLRPLLFNKQMSLHFPFEQNSIQLKVNQKLYPESRAHFQILNESVPQPYKRKFVSILNKYHETHNVFDTLKFFQNSFEKNYESAKFKLQNQHFKKVQLKQKIQAEREKIRQDLEQKTTKIEQHHNHKNHHAEHGKGHHKNQQHKVEQENQKQQRAQQNNKKEQKIYVNPPPIKPIVIQNQKIVKEQVNEKLIKQYRDYFELDFNQHEKPEHQNLNDEITVDSLVMLNCPYLVLEKMLLYIECNCSKVLMYLFDAQQKKELKLWVKLKCKKCNDCVRIVWQRQVIHNKGQLISKMSFVNGKLVDIGGLGWKVGCNCDEQIIKPKLYLPGEKLQINCHTCFANMNITFNGLKHFNPFIKEFQLQDGVELPLRGSCNHDKLNFRWIRYACCGRPFACEECHDINAVKKHEIVNGLTMICGYCAYEQGISDECCKCKKELIKGQDKAGHWEGGLGCRDQTLLSRKDGKKYAGLGKTQSNVSKKNRQKDR